MTTATTALRDAADTIRDAAETGIQSIGGLLEDAKSRVDAVHIPKVTLKKQRAGGAWLPWLLVAAVIAAVAVLKSRSKSKSTISAKSTSSTPVGAQREPAIA